MTFEIQKFVAMNQTTGAKEIIEAPCKDAAREVYKDIHPHVKRGAIYVREFTDLEKERGKPFFF